MCHEHRNHHSYYSEFVTRWHYGSLGESFNLSCFLTCGKGSDVVPVSQGDCEDEMS